jgi:hypothetical protein
MEETFAIRLLKLQIEDVKGISPWNQTLVCDGKVLNDDDTIASTGIKDGAFMYCLNVAPQQEKAAVGVPADCTQVDCPTCGVLIAVPPELDEFQCPRCETICQAPPKYEGAQPGAPAPLNWQQNPMMNNQQQGPLVDKLGAPIGDKTDSLLMSPKSQSKMYRQQTQARLRDKEKAFFDAIKTEDEKRMQAAELGRSEAELVYYNWPFGQTQFWVRAFWLVQCPILNLLYYFTKMRRIPRDIRYTNFRSDLGAIGTPQQKEFIEMDLWWSDTDRAQNGFFWGWVFLLCWAPFYVWMLAGMFSVNFWVALISIIVGPFILLPICWSINSFCDACTQGCTSCYCSGDGRCCWFCNCSGGGGDNNGGGDCSCKDCCNGCGNCNCDCDCDMNCDCCDGIGRCLGDCCSACGKSFGDCCSGIGNCAEACGKCICACGDCNCGGCDCGGCDC